MTPELITAVLTPITVVILAYLTYLTNQRLKEVHRVAVQVDEAVNGKATGESSISQDVTTILKKQELDNPSKLVTTKSNGDASLRLQVAHLVKLVENLSGESAEQGDV